MTKILHTADIHLDSPLKSLALRDPDLRDAVQAASRTALTRITDLALSEGVAAVLIAGDLFDGAERSARTAAFLLGQLDRLGAAGIRVFYVRGNHDAENPITGAIDLPAHVHLFDGRGGRVPLTDDIWIHGISFTQRHAPDSLLPKFGAPVPGAVNIAMLHTSLAGAAGHDVYAPCAVSDMAALGFDYWALGHVHRRQVHATTPLIVMPGTPQGRDIGEPGPKTATLLTVADRRIAVQEVPTSAVQFDMLQIDISGTDSDDALRALLRDRLNAHAAALPSDTAILRLTLAGHPPRRWQILRDCALWAETAADLARGTGRLWVEKTTLDLTAPDAQPDSGGATDELARLMEEIRGEPGFAATLERDLEQALADLPPARRAALMPDGDTAAELGRSLARSGALGVIARLKGAEG